MTIKERLHAVWPRLFAPVDIASLVFFRVLFGFLLAFEVGRYFRFGWIKQFYIDPTFHFTYFGFGWVHPLPGNGMYFVFALLAVCALCILLGFYYRVAMPLFFLGVSYVFLIDRARYLNHFYLICLISFLMIFVPANRAFSIDAWRAKTPPAKTVPRWTLLILQAQLALMYVFAGIAKLGGDWLRGFPMRDMLAQHPSLPLLGPHVGDERVVLLFAWGGLFFDLFVVPLLLWRWTRWLALLAAAGFHGMNHFLFHIGIFPWFAMAGTLLFLAPDWPRRFLPKKAEKEVPPPPSKRARKAPEPTFSKAVVYVLTAYFAIQILLPLRHLLYPGDVNWTDEGQLFSWRMMLRAKQATGRFVAVDRFTGQQQMIYPARQLDREQVSTMWIQPDMILQYAHYTANQLRLQGWQVIEVHANVAASLNGRRAQVLIDPQANLAAEKHSLFPAKWIVPLTEPLPELKRD